MTNCMTEIGIIRALPVETLGDNRTGMEVPMIEIPKQHAETALDALLTRVRWYWSRGTTFLRSALSRSTTSAPYSISPTKIGPLAFSRIACAEEARHRPPVFYRRCHTASTNGVRTMTATTPDRAVSMRPSTPWKH